MKCILLCAGYSTRLYPLTRDQAKPLLSVAGKPMIEHIIEKISKVEAIEEIIVVSNNKFFNDFRNWKRKYSSTKPIKIINDGSNSNEDRLGAVGDINYVIKQEELNDDVFVVAGDNLFKFDLRRLFDFYDEKKASSIALYDVKDKSIAANKYGVVEIDSNNKIVEIEEKPAEPKTSLVSTACYIFSKDVVDELKKTLAQEKVDNIGDFLKWVLQNKDLYGLVFEEDWLDIGTHDQLKEANINWS